MVSVEEADKIIRSQVGDYGAGQVAFEQGRGRVLAEDLYADRDMPPYDRVAMDGIAIQYAAFEKGIRSFFLKATQAAGDSPVEIDAPEQCIEIMTGAALPSSADTVIRYEDLRVSEGQATLTIETIRKGQNVHNRGKDKQQGAIVVPKGVVITPAVIAIAASVGAVTLAVKKLPRAVIISTGDELVNVETDPLPWQVRRSNSYAIQAALQPFGLEADLLHIPDDAAATRLGLQRCLQQYDVILLSGGVSMGKFDYVPQVLEALAVQPLFYKVQQRPGKPFWFGRHRQGTLVFAFPGNPVSTFMCLHRYFLPWLKASLGMAPSPKLYAALDKEVHFAPALQYFLQVRLGSNENGSLIATPCEGGGSGDFANLVEANAFMELPAEANTFTNGQVFRVWPFTPLW